MAQAEDKTFASMADVVDQGCKQKFQHFISNSPWDDAPIIEQINQDANTLLGGKSTSCLLIDETSFPKQGKKSVGVARQWCGRLGKVDNCQVAVFGVLSDGERHAMIDKRLYLPAEWIDDPERCEQAGVPPEARQLVSKAEHARQIVQDARARGVQFAWVGMDAGYGKDPALLRALDDAGEVFVADVQKSQRVWTDDPQIAVPSPEGDTSRRHKRPAKLIAETPPVTVEHLVKTSKPSDWTRCILRDSTRGKLRVEIMHRRVWVWDGKEEAARCWHLIVRREIKSKDEIKYTLSNAKEDTTTLQLAQMQGQRYWVERAFQDAKGECGLADYQAQGWRAWHHHTTMVMLAMLFIAEQRAEHQPALALLTPRDIVEILSEVLPRKPESKEALIARINQRHRERYAAIESRYRSQEAEMAT